MRYNEILREILEMRKWTQVELGKELGITKQSVSKLLTGELKSIQIDTMMMYVGIMGCDLYIGESKITDKFNVKRYVKEKLKEKEITMQMVADELGLASFSGVSGRLDENRKKSIRIDSLIEILDILGEKLKVRDRMGSERVWELSIEEEREEERILRKYEELKKEVEKRGLK